MSPGARLFFAIRPPPAARDALAATARRLAREHGGRPVTAGRVHLTLCFIGAVSPERLDALRAAASRVRAAPFALRVDRLGAFPRVEVAWAGCVVPPLPLLALQEQLAGSLAQEGFAREGRRFVPHVTLVRRLGSGAAPDSRAVEPLWWRACRFSLLAAEPGQLRYAWLGSWALAPEPG